MVVTEHLPTIMQYTEDDVVEFMKLKKGDYLFWWSEFGDGPRFVNKFEEMRMRNGVPIIYSHKQYGGLVWGYLGQYKTIKKNMNYPPTMFWKITK